MITTSLQDVADSVVRRARRQGHVVPREVREELGDAGLSTKLWKDVLALARPSLSYRHGRYYYAVPASDRGRAELDRQQEVQRAVRKMVRQHRREASQVERRRQDRLDFVQTVLVVTEEGQELTLLTRDISATGVRLIGTCRLLGQKVQIRIPRLGQGCGWTFQARILWTCAVGDGLYENGASLLDVSSS